MSPDRSSRFATIAAVAAFMVAALVAGFLLGARSAAVTDDDLQVGRTLAVSRAQCQVDILMLPLAPEDRLEGLGGDPHIEAVCLAAQRLVRPEDPAPAVGTTP